MPLFFLGTTLSKDQLEEITGYIVNQYVKARSEIVKEILIRRKIAPTSQIRKIKFFTVSMNDYEKFSSKYSQVMIGLKEGLNIKSYAAFTVEDQNKVFENVNAKYPHGEMSKEMRESYVTDLDKEFGDRLVHLYEK
jgi:hypothetical protein